MVKAIKRAWYIREANRAAFKAQHYFNVALHNNWSAIGDNAFGLYRLYRERAATFLARAANV